MVSEGVDIPFLRVLVWATNIAQPLSFYQIVGRVLRLEQNVEFQDAMVFIPKEPGWWELAEGMHAATAEYRVKQEREKTDAKVTVRRNCLTAKVWALTVRQTVVCSMTVMDLTPSTNRSGRSGRRSVFAMASAQRLPSSCTAAVVTPMHNVRSPGTNSWRPLNDSDATRPSSNRTGTP